MIRVFLLVLAVFIGIELVHTGYHWDNCPKPRIFDRNF
jgi:hypothetical protein